MLSSPPSLSNCAAAPRRNDERRMRLANALRLAGRARRIEHDRHVVGPALGHFGVEKSGMRAVELAADVEQTIEARHALVVAQASRIVVIDVLQGADLRLRLENLVDLLLVLGQRVDDFGILEHVDEFRRRRVLVHRNRDAAQGLRRGHRPVEARPVVADDRKVHPAPKALRGEPARKRPHIRPPPGSRSRSARSPGPFLGSPDGCRACARAPAANGETSPPYLLRGLHVALDSSSNLPCDSGSFCREPMIPADGGEWSGSRSPDRT